jgi:hypothetical protein
VLCTGFPWSVVQNFVSDLCHKGSYFNCRYVHMRAGGEKRGSSTDRRRGKERLLTLYGNGTQVRCVWCRRLLTFRTVESDRIVPAGPYRFNSILPACRPCNTRRQQQPAWLFALIAKRPTWLLLVLKVPAALALYSPAFSNTSGETPTSSHTSRGVPVRSE